ncbi:MAG: nucleoside deaminase [Salinisphaera sp.]|nr:nucleoside deaminase [Salinisphaera sp.]
MNTQESPVTPLDQTYLARCVALAEQALDAGDEPFGSCLVDANGRILAEERNRVGTGDATQHPEFALARWATHHLSPAERKRCTVYTSGEHCAMCSAAHAWVGLDRLVYASSTKQLLSWLDQWGIDRSPTAPLAIQDVAGDMPVSGPDAELAFEVERLHRRYQTQRGHPAEPDHA